MILHRWKAADNDNTEWTDVTTLGTASYTGSPLKKEFQKSSGSGFNDLGHYLTAGIAAAGGLRFITFAQISSVTTTDVLVSGVTKSAAINNHRNFYISGSTLYAYLAGGSGVNALASNDPSPISVDTTYKFEQRIRAADGHSDFYVNDLEVISDPGTEGLDYRTGTLYPFANVERVGGTSGVLRWLENYITDDDDLNPPGPVEDAAVANGQAQIDYTFTETGISDTNADYISVEGSDVGGGSGFSEIEQAAVGSGGGSETGLSAGQERFYRFRAAVVVNGATYYSGYSGEVSATTDSPASDSSGASMPVAAIALGVKRGMLRNRGGR